MVLEFAELELEAEVCVESLVSRSEVDAQESLWHFFGGGWSSSLLSSLDLNHSQYEVLA